MPAERYPPSVRRVAEAVLKGSGATTTTLRVDVEAAAARVSGGVRDGRALPPELDEYVTKVALNAAQVSDDDVTRLKAAGFSEDEIFELTVSAALGAGLARLEAAADMIAEEG